MHALAIASLQAIYEALVNPVLKVMLLVVKTILLLISRSNYTSYGSGLCHRDTIPEKAPINSSAHETGQFDATISIVTKVVFLSCFEFKPK